MVFVLQGCLSSWIRLEDGTILPPGRSDFALGVSSVPRVYKDCVDGSLQRDSLGDALCVESRWDDIQMTSVRDTLEPFEQHTRHLLFGLTWRLGAFGPFGPFTGLELGLHAEAPNNPVTQEFRVALGLPGSDSLFAHTAIAGWGTGAWTDNSWFLQYAASRTWHPWRLFGTMRATLQGTQLSAAVKGNQFQHKRSWDFQSTVGGRFSLPDKRVLPDWMILACTADMTYEGLPAIGDEYQKSGFGLALTSGMGWSW